MNLGQHVLPALNGVMGGALAILLDLDIWGWIAVLAVTITSFVLGRIQELRYG